EPRVTTHRVLRHGVATPQFRPAVTAGWPGSIVGTIAIAVPVLILTEALYRLTRAARLRSILEDLRERLFEHGHRLALPAADELLSLSDLRACAGRVVGDREHGARDVAAVMLRVHVEEPFAEADVAPHEPFACLLGEPADDRRDAVADGHDWAVHL